MTAGKEPPQERPYGLAPPGAEMKPWMRTGGRLRPVLLERDELDPLPGAFDLGFQSKTLGLVTTDLDCGERDLSAHPKYFALRPTSFVL